MLERRHFSTPELLRDLFLDFQTGVFCNCVLNSETPPFCQITEENELIICGKAKGTGAHRIENSLRGDFVIDFSKYDSIDIEAKKVKQHGMLRVLFTPHARSRILHFTLTPEMATAIFFMVQHYKRQVTK